MTDITREQVAKALETIGVVTTYFDPKQWHGPRLSAWAMLALAAKQAHKRDDRGKLASAEALCAERKQLLDEREQQVASLIKERDAAVANEKSTAKVATLLQQDVERLHAERDSLRDSLAKCHYGRDAAREQSTAPVSPPTDDEIDRVVTRVVRAVAEIPDRFSPDDFPEAMLVTGDELRTILHNEMAVERERQASSAALAKITAADIAAGEQAVRDGRTVRACDLRDVTQTASTEQPASSEPQAPEPREGDDSLRRASRTLPPGAERRPAVSVSDELRAMRRDGWPPLSELAEAQAVRAAQFLENNNIRTKKLVADVNGGVTLYLDLPGRVSLSIYNDGECAGTRSHDVWMVEPGDDGLREFLARVLNGDQQ